MTSIAITSLRRLALAALAALALALAAGAPPALAGGGWSFPVDPSLKPPAGYESIGGVGGSVTRIDFRADTVVVATDDGAALDAFLGKWSGKVVSTIDPGPLREHGLTKQHLVRVDPSTAEAVWLEEDLTALKAGPPGTYRVSSDRARSLLALAAHESARGLTVGLDFLLSPDSIRSRSTLESANDLSGAYGRDAYTWPGFDNGAPGSRVGEAWNLLARAGRLPTNANRIPIAILDLGWSPLDPDMPVGSVGVGLRRNLTPCGGGTIPNCPFHGTNVTSAAVALPDNAFGAAGTAGPVARAVQIDRGATVFDAVGGIVETARAREAGVRIFNMSFSATIGAAVAVVVAGPADQALLALRASGALLFASAGNNGMDVDALDCFGEVACWESAHVWPCEAQGVLCVGGTAFASTNNDPSSNFAATRRGTTVDLWAPFHAAVGSDPGVAGFPSPAVLNSIHQVPGTSFSSPFAAGVAALVWAANPLLDPGAVEGILLDTARPGTRTAFAIVDAEAAVTRALGPDLPPDLALLAPRAGRSVSTTGTIVFRAAASDREDGTPTVRWTIDGRSSLGGVSLPTGTEITVRAADIGVGSHRVQAVAYDRAGHVVDDGIPGGTPFQVTPGWSCTPGISC